MKILKKGKVKIKSWKVKCYNCKSKLRYNESDINSDRDGDYVVCPVCGKFLSTDSSGHYEHYWNDH